MVTFRKFLNDGITLLFNAVWAAFALHNERQALNDAKPTSRESGQNPKKRGVAVSIINLLHVTYDSESKANCEFCAQYEDYSKISVYSNNALTRLRIIGGYLLQ